MASAAALLSPRAAHDQGLDNVNFDFDDLVEWNSTPSSSSSYFNNPFSTLNSNPNSPKSSNANLNSKWNFDLNSTSSTSCNPDSNSPSTSAHNQGSLLYETAPSNSETETLFRHHLSLELRKIGSPVNDSILDHYVKQHAQGLARANAASIQQSSSHATASSSRGNSPPELDPTASASSSSSSSSAASPTFSRRAFSLSPLPEEDQDQDRTAKAFKIHQENDGQFSHFGRSSLGMGMGMTLENSGFENHDHINGGQDSEMSSVDPSSLMINRGGSKEKDQDAMSEVEDGPAEAEETLADSKESLSALIAKNSVAEDSSSKQLSSDQQATQSSTDNLTSTSVTSLEKPPSSFSAFRPPRVGEPPLAPNYAQPSSVKPNLNLNKNNGEDDDETMITTNAVSLDDPDKPTPEEYKKMSSKEKRQLRNKISARNFRERRKGYIAQLEHEMQERDYTIASLRAQLERVGLQNYELKKEVKNLRSSAAAATSVGASTSEADAPSKPAQPAAATATAIAAAASSSSSGSAIGASISQADVQRILDAFQKSTVATQNQPSLAITSSDSTSRTVPAAIATTTTASRPPTPSGSSSRRPISPRPIHHSSSSSSLSSSSSIPVPNTRKDAFLSSDGSNSTSSFWAGGRSNSLLGNSGFMSVHTTLLPSISFNPGRIAPSDKKGKSNGGLTFRGLSNHFRSFKPEKGTDAIEKSSLPPPPAYSDHSFCGVKESEKTNKKESPEERFDVYDAFASLLRQGSTSQQPDTQGLEDATVDGEVLPSYLESVSAAAASPQATMITSTPQGQSLSQSLTDDAVEERVLEALYKAFSNENSSTSSFYPLDSKTSIAQNQSVDLHKLGALLDGKAELVLIDSETRREWTSQDGGRFGSRTREGIAARQ